MEVQNSNEETQVPTQQVFLGKLVTGIGGLLILVALFQFASNQTATKAGSEVEQQIEARTLEQWASALRGKNPEAVIAMLGRPDSAEEQDNATLGMVQWTIFEYRGLVANKYTGGTERLRIAFQFGGPVKVLKEGYSGRQIEVSP